ncbi:hypothetical protein [Halopiger goleimassiliensis]|uniref:hypothetical protein n=1 Tax=Halopiger goleimassiliensis TaxID=1293048 RepID=UPI0006778AC9|nr:hypothetical protein [Halopiger goleimassiliensis]
MGETYSLRCLFFVDGVENNPAFVRRTVESLRANGFETTSDSKDRDETIGRYVVGGETKTDTDATLDEVTSEIADSGSGTIESRIDDFRVEIRFDLDGETNNPLTLHGPRKAAFEEYDVPRDVARDRADRLADAIADLAGEIDPWFCVAWFPYPYKDVHPVPVAGKPPESGLETLGWVTVFGEPFHERFGGRDRLLEAPAWNVRDLDTGAVVLREAAVPDAGRNDVDLGPAPSTDEYLFEGESLADLRAEIERQRSTYVDPFRDLEDGELASDVVVCETHAPFAFEGIDYATFPDDLDRDDRCHVLCVRRDGDALWAANNDEFIRRLVDTDGKPIGDRPDGVSSDREFISLLVATAYDDDTSLDLYRMDGPDDPSVIGGLLGSERVPEGESVWQDRDEPVTRE